MAYVGMDIAKFHRHFKEIRVEGLLKKTYLICESTFGAYFSKKAGLLNQQLKVDALVWFSRSYASIGYLITRLYDKSRISNEFRP